jgi:S-DNA-T family DNA segregation ATPase FtsK/SpoIIIE
MLEKQLTSEIGIINRAFHAFGIDAGTKAAWTVIAGTSFVAYGLRFGPSQRISDVQRILPELSERLSAARRCPTPVRLRAMPPALEVAHPEPKPLDWRIATMRVGGHKCIAGRIYNASSASDLVVDLNAKPHVLIAGTTGSGKSTMLRMMLSSLSYNADPESLRMALVDLKNEDLVPFAKLPHVEMSAWTGDDARHVVTGVHVELQRRVLAGVGDWHRLVLVIDELAQLDQASLDLLSGILAIGRSKRVHVIAATQHPAVRLIGDKSNYSTRLVGQVMDAQTAALATGRKGSGAELLPGAGAFLYVDGATLERLQAYNLNAETAERLVQVAQDKWCDAPVRTGAPVEKPVPAPQTSLPEPVRTGATFPLPRRAPTPAEAVEIRRMRAELGSLNQLIVAVYGSKSSDTHRWVSEALSQHEAAPILKLGAR